MDLRARTRAGPCSFFSIAPLGGANGNSLTERCLRAAHLGSPSLRATSCPPKVQSNRPSNVLLKAGETSRGAVADLQMSRASQSQTSPLALPQHRQVSRFLTQRATRAEGKQHDFPHEDSPFAGRSPETYSSVVSRLVSYPKINSIHDPQMILSVGLTRCVPLCGRS